MTLLDSALFYAGRGWHVFPCLAGLKTPATRHGWHDATTDPDRIRAWWRVNPNYNVAIATGPSGLFVIDIDPGAEAEWAKLIASDVDLAMALQDTYAVQTPRGGWHYYFTGEGRTSASRIAPNVDTRAIGGYVLAPPSRVSDSKAQGSYTLAADKPLQALPAVIAERMAVRDDIPLAPALPADSILWDAPETLIRAEAWLEGLVGAGEVAVEGCGGNTRTYQTACRLLEMGIKPDTAYLLLLRDWNPFCIPPWEDQDLETIVRNAWEHGQETRGNKAELPLDIQHQHLLDAAQGEPEADDPDLDKYATFDPQWISEVRRNLQPLEWLLPNYLPKVGVGYLFGPSGTFKTFVALDLAMSIATGHGPNWWQDGDREPMPVVYFAGESPHAFAGQRIDSWLHRHLIPGLEAKNRMLFVDKVPPTQLHDVWRFVTRRIKHKLRKAGHDRPALIVIDTLSRLMEGEDISNQQGSSAAFGRVERMAKELQCCVVLVHHTGKDPTKGMVGSYVWYSNADTVVEISRENPVTTAVLLETRKQKESDPGDPKRFVGAVYGDSIAFERDWDAKFVSDLEGAQKLASGPGSEEWCQPEALVAILREGPMQTEHLADSLALHWQVSKIAVLKRLRKLAKTRYRAWLLTENIWSIPTVEQPPEVDVSIF
jgi:Bifunctional DNA primase/polymerase, N-terminal/AAA domain